MDKKTVIFSILVFSAFYAYGAPAATASGTTANTPSGYSLDDKDGNGITDAFESVPPDTAKGSTPALGQPADVQQREGHRNYHGLHGKELDRGESPHAH
jgi:hypothetical protein